MMYSAPSSSHEPSDIEQAEPVEQAVPELPLVVGAGLASSALTNSGRPMAHGSRSMPVFPTTDGLFDAVYACTGDEAETVHRARIETALAIKQRELEIEAARDERHQILEQASMDPFEGTPPAALNAFLYAREHKLGPMLESGLMAVPLLGTVIGGAKLARRGLNSLPMLESAPKQLPYYPPIGRGLTSTVREFGSDEVLKEIQPKRRHTYEPIEITPEEKERLAESIVVVISWLRESLGELIPETRLAGPGFIRQTKIDGTGAAQQGFFKRTWAYFRLRRAVRKAVRALNSRGAPPIAPNGWTHRIDRSGGNLRFDKQDRMRWVDPVLIGDDNWWR